MSKRKEYTSNGKLMFKFDNFTVSISPSNNDYSVTITKPNNTSFSMIQSKDFFYEYDLIEVINGVPKPTYFILSLVD